MVFNTPIELPLKQIHRTLEIIRKNFDASSTELQRKMAESLFCISIKTSAN